jgi:hypothetical protein
MATKKDKKINNGRQKTARKHMMSNTIPAETVDGIR